MLLLLPAYLSDESPRNFFAPVISEYIERIDHYFVENEKTARKVIKFFCPEKKQSELKLFVLNKDTPNSELKTPQQLMVSGVDFALLSEAGLPCIADPGNIMVQFCHQKNIQVVPVSGPSSMVLGLIASGFNGQEFSFNGYLPIEKSSKKAKLQALENLVNKTGYTQIFMETPYRNNQLLADCIQFLHPETRLCIAANINHPTAEFIKTKKINEWKKSAPDLHKIPAVFIIGK